MGTVRFHRAESDRLDSLRSYGVLDTPPEDSYDALARLAAQLCDAPIASVTLIDHDRQWAKALHGPGSVEDPRESSFCSDAVAAGAVLVVPDATADPRYATNVLVTSGPQIRAYAGVPLIGRDGLPVGTLCVLDQRPRAFTPGQLRTLAVLADQVVALLEQRRRDRTSGLLDRSVIAQARDPRRLRAALDAGELVPHYQPILDLASGAPYGLEALLRWEHPQLGLLPPSAFLPAIEDSALVVPVGRDVLDRSLARLAELRRDHAPLAGGVAVNVASGQLARPGLARDVLAALDRYGLAGTELALEVTEATALPDPELALRELGEVVAAGVHVVIDDFGVGWSNLSRILQLPVHALKVDRSIAGAVLTSPAAAAMVDSTVQLAGRLGLHVVAEGVETEQVRRRLTEAGCEWGQGWLFSAAVPGDALPSALSALHARARPSAFSTTG